MSKYAFQDQDVIKLIQQPNALICNDMGTGKTYEGVKLDIVRRQVSNKSDAVTIVVCPKSVMPKWKEVFETLSEGQLQATIFLAKTRAVQWKEWLKKPTPVIILNWELLRLMPELREHTWFHIIVDECHRAQNRKAQQTRALKTLKSTFKTAMSGTPVTNAPYQFWSILNWLYPKEYSSYWRFYAKHVDFEVQYPQGYHKIKGPKNVELLHDQMNPYYVRHTKKEVLPDLPDKYYTDIWVDLLPEQRRAYNQMRDEMIAWVGKHEEEMITAPVVVAQMMRLQQFAVASLTMHDSQVIMAEPSAKLNALMEILEDNPGVQIVVFSQFKQLINLTEKKLIRAGISNVLYTGDVKDQDRWKAESNFQKGNAQVFLGTIGAGGEGITLTAASNVIFLDRTWSPPKNIQAEDRCHRDGQRSAVQVIDIMAKNTVDLGRDQKLEMKWSWIKQLLGDK